MDRRLIAFVIVLVSVVGIGGIAMLLGNQSLAQLPPPDELPNSDSINVNSGNVTLWAEAVYWQDFMPSNDSNHPFYTRVTVNITNNGNTTLEHLGAIRTTIYYNGTFTPFVTLNLTQAYLTFNPITVPPGHSTIIEYHNSRKTVFSPTIDEGTALYSRILFVWDFTQEAILTTIPTELYFTF